MKPITKTILVVDDRPNWRKLLKTIFTSPGDEYIVHTAANPNEAVNLLEKHSFGMVITNLGLEPAKGSYDRSGLKVIDKLQEQAPGTPCIILTAFDDTVREQVENYCIQYDASIWVMWKWENNVYKNLKGKVQLVFGENLENSVSIGM